MTNTAVTPLAYDPAGAFIEGSGIGPERLAALTPRLEQARTDVLSDFDLWRTGGPIAADRQPLEPGFVGLPEQMLGEYRQSRATSQLNQILSTARKLSSLVDRVVVLGCGGSYMAARALFESCCHPHHNELSRAERGGRPRIYFAGNNVDNDATQGLIDLLSDRPTRDVEERWGIVVISKSGETLETAVAFRQFLSVLRRACVDDMELVADLVVPITGNSGRLFQLSRALGCEELLPVADGVSARFAVMSAAGLLPGALMGIDIIKLLEGAAALNAHFREAPAGENIVLKYAGVCHLWDVVGHANVRVLSLWGNALSGVGYWYDQLVAESLGKQEQGVTPFSVVNTRDLHSRGQQHQQGRHDKLITNVIVEAPRRDKLTVGSSDLDEDQLNPLADRSLGDLMSAALAGMKQAYEEEHRPTADLRLPKLNELALGQFFQMMMLATVVEAQLLDINPYGQPGVEAYKKHMNALLRKS
jgi:glucose-6-phosphate isomerase